MIMRESNISYNIKKNRVITRKPRHMDQRAWEGKQALQQYSRTSLQRMHYPRSDSNKNNTERDTKKRG